MLVHQQCDELATCPSSDQLQPLQYFTGSLDSDPQSEKPSSVKQKMMEGSDGFLLVN